MERVDIINLIGREYLTMTPNSELGEYNYKELISKDENIVDILGYNPEHFVLDIRFKCDNVVVLVETKGATQNLDKKAKNQLQTYVYEEKMLNNSKQIIAILYKTNTDEIYVYKNSVDNNNLLKDETVLQPMSHYVDIFKTIRRNNREQVLKNTYDLNEDLHKMDIDEKLRSQFVGTVLLYVKDYVAKRANNNIEKAIKQWDTLTNNEIVAGITGVLENLLSKENDETKKKEKINLLETTIFENQRVKTLSSDEWHKVLRLIARNIFAYIDTESDEGQDILNLFFIAFNKYVGKADKNQAFTPDHITEFMCQLVDVDRNKIVLDPTCGSGSFLVQAMVKELSDCHRGVDDKEATKLMDTVKKKHIYGIEVENTAYGLATTNMLIHGDGNSNVIQGDCFKQREFIIKANPDIILLNPPYNSKPKNIPDEYKANWSAKEKDGKDDPTSGLVFVHFLADMAKETGKQIKLAVLLPVACAIGSSQKPQIVYEKNELLKNNTLEAVFSLPDNLFYPGAGVCDCCMLFTLNQPHYFNNGEPRQTFFGYCRQDGFKVKKNLGRVEQFDSDGISIWKEIESEWLSLYRNKQVVDGKSAVMAVSGNDEWLCEAYMKTDYSKLTEADFQETINNYLAYLVKEGCVNDDN